MAVGGKVVRAEAGAVAPDPASGRRPGNAAYAAPVPHTARGRGGEPGEVGRRGGRRGRCRRRVAGGRGCRGGGCRPVPGPAGGGGLAVEHAEFVVDAVGGGGGGNGRAEVVRLRGLLLGGRDVAQHAVYRRHLKGEEQLGQMQIFCLIN